MKNLVAALVLSLVSVMANAAIENLSVDAGASQGLYLALVKAGARANGPAAVSQTIIATQVKCVGGFNEMTKKSQSECSFVDGDKSINVTGETAEELLGALIKAKLINRGPGEISGGSLRSLSCIKTNMDGAKTYGCDAMRDAGGNAR